MSERGRADGGKVGTEMSGCVALLRGINVGGKHLIKMADLRSWLESLGLGQVQTYIQSGNIVFRSEEKAVALERRLAEAISAAAGFPVPVLVRTAEEIGQLIDDCPWSAEKLAAAAPAGKESLHVCFLPELVSAELSEQLWARRGPGDQVAVHGREIYLLFAGGMLQSRLAAGLQRMIENGTVRNWRTVSKLASLAAELPE